MTQRHDDMMMIWWHDYEILRSHVYGLICLKLKTQLSHFKSILNMKLWLADLLTYLLTRVKSRDASASKKSKCNSIENCANVFDSVSSGELFLWRSLEVVLWKAWEWHTPTERLRPWMSGHPCKTPWETFCSLSRGRHFASTPWETETFTGSLRDSWCRFGGRKRASGHMVVVVERGSLSGNSCAIQLKSVQSFLRRETQLQWGSSAFTGCWTYEITEQSSNVRSAWTNFRTKYFWHLGWIIYSSVYSLSDMRTSFFWWDDAVEASW